MRLVTSLLLACTWKWGGGHHWGNIKRRLQASPQSGTNVSCHSPYVMCIQKILPKGTTWYPSMPDMHWSTKWEDSNFFWQHTETNIMFLGAPVTCFTSCTRSHWNQLFSVIGDAMSFPHIYFLSSKYGHFCERLNKTVALWLHLTLHTKRFFFPRLDESLTKQRRIFCELFLRVWQFCQIQNFFEAWFPICNIFPLFLSLFLTLFSLSFFPLFSFFSFGLLHFPPFPSHHSWAW